MNAEEITIISGLPPEQAAALASMPEGSKFDFKEVLGGKAILTDGRLTFSLPCELMPAGAVSLKEISATGRMLAGGESTSVIKSGGTWHCAQATIQKSTGHTIWQPAS